MKKNKLTAVLGPTNTGKTYLAIETMLSFNSGMIGFPLRLLAREVYDKIIKKINPTKVALITGEEKIIPSEAKYYLCTVESMPIDKQVDLAIKLVEEGVDIIQTEGGTSSTPYSSGIQGFFEKSVPTLAATYAIHQEFKKQSLNIPIMSASGLSQVTCPLAISSGASAVGVGSVVNKLDDLISMIAVVRGLKESLKNSIIREKIS